MTGDIPDFVWRLLTMLPARWFGTGSSAAAQPPLLAAVLTGFATAWSRMFTLLQQVRAQARIRTASGAFLDMIAADYFGALLTRRPGEADAGFQGRILLELLRPKVTRAALVKVLSDLTGHAPGIFEPARASDTGGYNAGGCGYGVAGGWGSLALPYASFVTAYRPAGAGIAFLAGYGTGGPLAYGNLSLVETPVTDAMIAAACVSVLPSGSVAWLRITDP